MDIIYEPCQSNSRKRMNIQVQVALPSLQHIDKYN